MKLSLLGFAHPVEGSLRNQLICKGTVVPTDGAKLMVLFLSILGWSSLESLGLLSGRVDIQYA